MKLISLNVALFEANNTKLKKFITSEKPDFICLQEITRSLESTVNKEYVTKDIVDKATTYLPYFFFGPNSIMGNFEQKNFHGKELYTFEFGGLMEFGNYTKSKYPLVKGQNVFVQNSFTYTTDASNWPEEDYRAVLVTDHVVNGKKLKILNYHGIWTRNKLGNETCMKANKIINDLVLQAEGEVILCGDFNLFPDTKPMKLFEKNLISLVDTYTIKTTRPETNELHGSNRNVVDYVWVSKGINVNDFQVLNTTISDHLPLVLDFQL